MLPLVFIGGAIAGAAGLTTAALWDKKKREAEFPLQLQQVASLNAQDICELLTDYCIKANLLSSRCSLCFAQIGEACTPTIELPDETALERIFRKIDSRVTPVMRRWKHQQFLSFRDEARDLYARYRGVFGRGNELLLGMGKVALMLRDITFRGCDFSLDNSAANEDWDMQLDDMADLIRNYLDKSVSIAEQLIACLEGEGNNSARIAIAG